MRELESRTAERVGLLDRIQQMLANDARVAAAWMFGSLGRGTEDAWSDLDIYVVLSDAEYADIARNRREFVSRLQEPMLYVEAPQNGPPGGIYLMSVYDAPTGPHAVDWYFQPASCARRLDSRRVLAGRLEELSDAPPVSGFGEHQWKSTPETDDANRASLFWVMLMVQGKYVARDPLADGMACEGFIGNLLREVAEFHGETVYTADSTGYDVPGDKVERLLSFGAEMARVAPEYGAPFEAVSRFLGLVSRVTK